MTHDEQLEKLKAKFGDAVVLTEKDRVMCPIVWVKKEKIIEILSFLKEADGYEYSFLSDLTCYDDMGTKDESKGRFVMVYNLLSPQYKNRIRVKARVNDGESISTAISVWASADWAEREVFDMFGVKFEGHPDLRRILMDVRWEGHPLRKDYPLKKYQLFNDPEPMPMHLLKD